MSGKTEQVIRAMLAMQRYPWEQGVCAQALYEAGREELWIPMAYDAIKRQAADGRLAMAGGGAAVSDPAANGEVCLRAWEKTGDRFFLDGAERMLEYLEKRAPRTEDGIICHNEKSFHEGHSSAQLWIDGLYMAPPFLAAMGRVTEAAEQIRGYIAALYDGEAGVFRHIIDTAQHRYVRDKHWATGNGWALMGLARVTEAAEAQGYPEIARETGAFCRKLMEAMLRYQTEDGRFHDILDEEDSFSDGTSAMMMAAAVYRGVLHGYIGREALEAAERAWTTVTEKIDGMGLVREVCGCPHFTDEGTSAEAQAATIMADSWRKQLRG
ncbi:MAG: glycoside hydrolase family 88 protein [Clostridia bacterium]|nr:glycoside hydrolase family 88 protein [Clostridia bacterium]